MADTEQLKIKSRLIHSCNILNVAVGTNCPKGGDAGHGGITYFSLDDGACTAWALRVTTKIPGSEETQTSTVHPEKVELILGGDCECDTLIEALRFAADTLAAERSLNQAPYPGESLVDGEHEVDASELRTVLS